MWVARHHYTLLYTNWLHYNIAMYTELLVCVLTSIIHSYDGYISSPCSLHAHHDVCTNYSLYYHIAIVFRIPRFNLP